MLNAFYSIEKTSPSLKQLHRVLCPDVYGRFSTMDAKQEIPWIEIPNAHKIPRITVCLLPSLGYQAAQRKAEMAPKGTETYSIYFCK